MRGWWRHLLVLLCACKAEIGGGPNPNDPDAANSTDAAIDAAPDAFGTFAPWSTPVVIPGPNGTANEDDGTLSNSKLEMIYALSDPNIDAGRKHLYYIRRPTVTSMAWTTPVRLSFNLDGTADETPRFSADDKTLYFGSGRPGTTGGLDIWQITRPTVGLETGWTGLALVGGVNSTSTDKWCMPCSNGRYLMSSSRAPGTGSDDIWEGPAMGQAPSRVNELSMDGFSDNGVFISSDCRTLYFASNRSGTNRIYKTQRATSSGTWDAPQLLPDFMTTGTNQSDPFITGDLRTFVFAANTGAATGTDMYITTR